MNRIAAESAAWQLHQHFAITHPDEINVDLIAMHRNVFVCEGRAPGADAWLARGANIGLVRVSNTIRERGRRRFAVAHELGHWELHAEESQFGALCQEKDLRDYANSPQEAEANIFAAEFLMPSKLFRGAIQRQRPSLRLIKELAEMFDTSLTATAMRYVELAEHECLVVFSEDGRMRFWRGRREGEYWLTKEQAIPEASQAWQCWMNGVEESPQVEIVAAAWFPHIAKAMTLSLVEESMRLGAYNSVMSLLWLE